MDPFFGIALVLLAVLVVVWLWSFFADRDELPAPAKRSQKAAGLPPEATTDLSDPLDHPDLNEPNTLPTIVESPKMDETDSAEPPKIFGAPAKDGQRTRIYVVLYWISGGVGFVSLFLLLASLATQDCGRTGSLCSDLEKVFYEQEVAALRYLGLSGLISAVVFAAFGRVVELLEGMRTDIGWATGALRREIEREGAAANAGEQTEP